VGAPNKEARPYDSRFRVIELLKNDLQQAGASRGNGCARHDVRH
jgi:hypothetical protein